MRKKIILAVSYLIFLCLLCEAMSRGYYAIKDKIPFFLSCEKRVMKWYPEIEKLEAYEYQDENLNILLLGGSVLTKEWGQVPVALRRVVAEVFGKRANIVNLAAAAHSSLDSYYKYTLVTDRKFDVVILYHGVNEVRANNVPREIWRDDYSHYSWYDEVRFFIEHPLLRKLNLVTPFFIKDLSLKFQRKFLNDGAFVPPHYPREKWLDFGADIKSRVSFEINVRSIVEMAGSRGEPLVLMTFAYYRPAENKLLSARSSYSRALRVWGRPENIFKGIATHNDVIRQISASEDVIFIDQRLLIGNKPEPFTDICHFSVEGSDAFSRHLVREMKEKLHIE